jgi:hypothetical protein
MHLCFIYCTFQLLSFHLALFYSSLSLLRFTVVKELS